jgi:hypothetical protein
MSAWFAFCFRFLTQWQSTSRAYPSVLLLFVTPQLKKTKKLRLKAEQPVVLSLCPNPFNGARSARKQDSLREPTQK